MSNKNNITNEPIRIFVCSLEQRGIDDQIENYRHLLVAQERARLTRISNKPARKLFVASRILLRKQLGIELQLEPREVSFVTDANGKPHINQAAIHTPHFNLSHSKQLVALAISYATPVGIDIENIQRQNRLTEIAKRYFTAHECQQLALVSYKREMFFDFWTLKEAYIKALGLGLRKGLDTFGFDLRKNIVIRDDVLDTANTSFFSYHLQNDYQLSVCLLKNNLPEPRLFSVDAAFNPTEFQPALLPHLKSLSQNQLG